MPKENHCVVKYKNQDTVNNRRAEDLSREAAIHKFHASLENYYAPLDLSFLIL